jgi:hypothetical protein
MTRCGEPASWPANLHNFHIGILSSDDHLHVVGASPTSRVVSPLEYRRPSMTYQRIRRSLCSTR